MTRIAELGKNYENLPDMLAIYVSGLADAKEKIKITGKKLEISNSENSAWLHYYDARRVELYTLVKFFEVQVESVKSKLYKSYKEGHSLSLGEREINKYINSEEAYLNIYGILLEVEEVHDLYKVVVAAFTSRNYTLSNITKIRVASLENVDI